MFYFNNKHERLPILPPLSTRKINKINNQQNRSKALFLTKKTPFLRNRNRLRVFTAIKIYSKAIQDLKNQPLGKTKYQIKNDD